MCTESADAGAQHPQTKICSQCKENREKDQFPKKEWKRKEDDRLCRLCYEFSVISDEMTRKCRECDRIQPRDKYNIHQWEKGADALCMSCVDKSTGKVLARAEALIDGSAPVRDKHNPDGTSFCKHDLEFCEICCVDFSLQNKGARMRTSLGRDLTAEEHDALFDEHMKQADLRIHSKVCIMDGLPMCPRSGRKLRCPCNEVTYCSKACQLSHWSIHKMTCKVHLKKKMEKKLKQAATSQTSSSRASHGLTEEQLDYIRIEAFMAENSGVEHAIEECAWQLGEHPLVIGGGSIQMSASGQKFVKGDVAKIYREGKGVEWDGSPRFGLGPYVQQKTPFDWITKARDGRSQREKDLARGNSDSQPASTGNHAYSHINDLVGMVKGSY